MPREDMRRWPTSGEISNSPSRQTSVCASFCHLQRPWRRITSWPSCRAYPRAGLQRPFAVVVTVPRSAICRGHGGGLQLSGLP
ncbi:hypothetical protein QN277_022389 [Acacia crassicarpa]|uniref:Uncharacterized protein n=1 Tax=Acacia crassicarpa TaxID=499986 RepID=A0AAE1MQM3_9FABA|nr:hypothetical protein QN277_022389 [Acacia crassicarpa]